MTWNRTHSSRWKVDRMCRCAIVRAVLLCCPVVFRRASEVILDQDTADLVKLAPQTGSQTIRGGQLPAYRTAAVHPTRSGRSKSKSLLLSRYMFIRIQETSLRLVVKVVLKFYTSWEMSVSPENYSRNIVNSKESSHFLLLRSVTASSSAKLVSEN